MLNVLKNKQPAYPQLPKKNKRNKKRWRDINMSIASMFTVPKPKVEMN